MTAATTDLVKSVSIENMLRQRDAIIERYRQIATLMREADDIALNAGFGSVCGHLNHQYDRSGGVTIGATDMVEQLTKRVDASGWKYLMNESGLRTLMDAKARDEWDKGVYEYKTPPLTAANVTSTFTMLHDGRAELFERGVIHCFKRLNWSYKTNQPFKFGKRLVVTHLYYKAINNWTQGVNHSTANELDDLVRVFSVLDGKPEPDHRNGMYVYLTRAATERQHTIELDYFTVKWFKNGNGHLTFKRPELVEKLNLILAKHYPNAIASEVR